MAGVQTFWGLVHVIPNRNEAAMVQFIKFCLKYNISWCVPRYLTYPIRGPQTMLIEKYREFYGILEFIRNIYSIIAQFRPLFPFYNQHCEVRFSQHFFSRGRQLHSLQRGNKREVEHRDCRPYWSSAKVDNFSLLISWYYRQNFGPCIHKDGSDLTRFHKIRMQLGSNCSIIRYQFHPDAELEEGQKLRAISPISATPITAYNATHVS